VISPGTFNTPAGFADRATIIDDSLPHQIRIVAPGSHHPMVTCTCRRGEGPIHRIATCEEAWTIWRDYHQTIIPTPEEGAP
jgi:hypothetical protein